MDHMYPTFFKTLDGMTNEENSWSVRPLRKSTCGEEVRNMFAVQAKRMIAIFMTPTHTHAKGATLEKVSEISWEFQQAANFAKNACERPFWIPVVEQYMNQAARHSLNLAVGESK